MSDGILHSPHDDESPAGSATIDATSTSSRADENADVSANDIGFDAANTVPPPTPVNGKTSADDESVQEQPRRFGLSRGDQYFLGCIAGLMLLMMLAHALKASRWSLQPVELVHHPEREWEFHLDINSATWVEWMQLEGIGERLALRIVEDRKSNGPFKSIDDLSRVLGIGPKTIERLKPHLRCDLPDTAATRRPSTIEPSVDARNR